MNKSNTFWGFYFGLIRGKFTDFFFKNIHCIKSTSTETNQNSQHTKVQICINFGLAFFLLVIHIQNKHLMYAL